MTLPELQSCLNSLGIKLSLRLVVDAPAGVMTTELRGALATHKPRLLALLSGVGSSIDPAPPDRFQDLRERLAAMPVDDYAVEERAAIMEFDGGLPREEAERRAGLRKGGAP